MKKRKEETFYVPDTFTSIRNSLQPVIVARGSKIDLREGASFMKSRQVLAFRRKEPSLVKETRRMLLGPSLLRK